MDKPVSPPFNSRREMMFWHIAPAVLSTIVGALIVALLAFFWGLPAVVDAIKVARDDPFTGTDGRQLKIELLAADAEIIESMALLSDVQAQLRERLRQVEIDNARLKALMEGD